MKKSTITFISAFLGLLIVLCFTACNSEPVQDQPITADINLQTIMDDISAKVQMPDETFALTNKEDLIDYFGIDSELVKNFAVVMQSNGLGNELIMIETYDATSASQVADDLNVHLQDSMKTMESYNAQQYAVLEKCHVDINGSYVSLFVAENADEMIEIYNSYFAV